MNLDALQKNIKKNFFEYRIHLFVFLLTVFIALTIAHPAVLLNDEFITTNQLHQLQAGHQIVVFPFKCPGIFNSSSFAFTSFVLDD